MLSGKEINLSTLVLLSLLNSSIAARVRVMTERPGEPAPYLLIELDRDAGGVDA